jgi:hypothetical protein
MAAHRQKLAEYTGIVSSRTRAIVVGKWRDTLRRTTNNHSDVVAIRYRGEHPLVWKRIIVVSFFSLLAFGITHALWVNPRRHLLGLWSIPSLFWLIAMMAAIDAFIPRPDRRWTVFVVSGAFGTLAILGIAGIIHGRSYRLSGFLAYTLLMAGLSIVSAAMGLRVARHKPPETRDRV